MPQTRTERNIEAMKKTKRIYTPITNIKHMVSILESRGERTMFDYFDAEGNIRKITYRALAARVTAFGSGLYRLGRIKGKRTAIIGETSPSWYVAYLATVMFGGTAIPMDKELAIAEIENFLCRAEADNVVFSPLFAEKFRDVAARHPEIAFIPMAGAADAPYYKSMEEIESIGTGRPHDPSSPSDMDRLAVMLFTSGTTGTSKCVMLSEKNICAAINSACEAVDFFPRDVLVSVLPIHHTYELCCSLAAANYGCEIAINDSLRHCMRNFQTFRPTALVLVPLFLTTMDKKVWDEIRKKGVESAVRGLMKLSDGTRKIGLDPRRLLFRDILAAFGGRLEKIICGGAPLDPKIAADFRSLGIEVWEGYGITECSPLIAVDVYYHSKPGSVGPAVTSCMVRIEDAVTDEDGHDIGEICVKGKNVMLGYYKDEAATADAFTADGWFRTGDLGYLDDEGYIYITGRKKSVIVLENGKNVFPEEIEEYLASVDKIAECVVVGRKNGRETVLTAVVFPNAEKFEADTPESEMLAAVRADVNKLNRRLVGYKQVRNVELRTTPFEKTTSMKIKRHLVK